MVDPPLYALVGGSTVQDSLPPMYGPVIENPKLTWAPIAVGVGALLAALVLFR